MAPRRRPPTLAAAQRASPVVGRLSEPTAWTSTASRPRSEVGVTPTTMRWPKRGSRPTRPSSSRAACSAFEHLEHERSPGSVSTTTTVCTKNSKTCRPPNTSSSWQNHPARPVGPPEADRPALIRGRTGRPRKNRGNHQTEPLTNPGASDGRPKPHRADAPNRSARPRSATSTCLTGQSTPLKGRRLSDDGQRGLV